MRMSLTILEIKERILQQYDTDDLIDALDISAEELLDRFEDKLINRYDEFIEDLEDEHMHQEYKEELDEEVN